MYKRIAIYCIVVILFSIVVTTVHTADGGDQYEDCPICRAAVHLSSSIPAAVLNLQQSYTITTYSEEVSLLVPDIASDRVHSRAPPV